MAAAGGGAREIGSNLQTLPGNGLLQESESHIRRGSPSLNTPRAGYTIQAGGPVAQGQSDRLITGWLEVRILPGPPFCVMVQAARIEEYIRSRLPQSTDVSVANVQRLPGGVSRG